MTPTNGRIRDVTHGGSMWALAAMAVIGGAVAYGWYRLLWRMNRNRRLSAAFALGLWGACVQVGLLMTFVFIDGRGDMALPVLAGLGAIEGCGLALAKVLSEQRSRRS